MPLLRLPGRLALGLLIAFSMGIVVTAQNDTLPEPLCGDCWCVPGEGQSCPNFEGLRESFPAEWISALRSFVRIESPDDFVLQPADGCFPFGEAIASQLDATDYPESADPACQVPPLATSDAAVCAFVFPNGVDGTEACQGRSYRVQTFANEAEALQHHNDTAPTLIVHRGACGVCSNAADLAGRAATLQTMNSINVVCATDYVLNIRNRDTRFATLTDCYVQATKLSRPCATLWAHFGATNGALCAGDCILDVNREVVLNDPTDCSLSRCLDCSATRFEEAFNDMAGLYKSPYNTGLLDPVAYPCDFFYRIQDTTWDPCVGAVPGAAVAPPPPTPPPGSAFQPRVGEMFVALAIIMGWIVL